jgi:hypothetical protein
MENIESKPLGVIDALSLGFELVLRHPWVLLVPVALDLFLRWGPQIQARPVLEPAAKLFMALVPRDPSPDSQQAMTLLAQNLQANADHFNIFSCLALFGLGVPSLVPLNGPDTLFSTAPVWVSIEDATAFSVLVVLFALLGVLVGTLYFETLARPIRHEAGGLRTFVPRVFKSFLNILALVITLGIAAFFLFIPFGAGVVLLLTLSPGLAVFLFLMIWLIVMWAALYLAFAVPAIFVSGANALQAILNSVTIFRYNSWSAMGLIFLIILIQMGFSVIFQQLLDNTLGFVVGMIANAVLGTALIAAGMLFYYDRFTWLTQVRERIHQQQRPSFKE